jgi:hypothetical protein
MSTRLADLQQYREWQRPDRSLVMGNNIEFWHGTDADWYLANHTPSPGMGGDLRCPICDERFEGTNAHRCPDLVDCPKCGLRHLPVPEGMPCFVSAGSGSYKPLTATVPTDGKTVMLGQAAYWKPKYDIIESLKYAKGVTEQSLEDFVGELISIYRTLKQQEREPMTLARAVEVLNSREHRGIDNWSIDNGNNSVYLPYPHSSFRLTNFEALAIAEKLEREAK